MSDQTRERVQRLARDEFGGASADETVRRLLDEHWEAAALAAVQRFRTDDPDGWAYYLADAEESDAADAAITDEWRPA